MPAVGCCSCNATKIHMACCGKQVDPVVATLHIRTPVDGIIIHVENPEHYVIGIVVVVAVLRSIVP